MYGLEVQYYFNCGFVDPEKKSSLSGAVLAICMYIWGAVCVKILMTKHMVLVSKSIRVFSKSMRVFSKCMKVFSKQLRVFSKCMSGYLVNN